MKPRNNKINKTKAKQTSFFSIFCVKFSSHSNSFCHFLRFSSLEVYAYISKMALVKKRKFDKDEFTLADAIGVDWMRLLESGKEYFRLS